MRKPGVLEEEGTAHIFSSPTSRKKGEGARWKRVNHPRATGGMASFVQYGYNQWALNQREAVDVKTVWPSRP